MRSTTTSYPHGSPWITLSILTNSARISLPPVFWFTRSTNAGGKLCSCPKRIPIFFITVSLSFRAKPKAKSRNLLLLSVLQDVHTQIKPTWVESTNQRNFLCPRPFLQLALARKRVANITARNKLAFCTDSQMRTQSEFPRGAPKFAVRDGLLRRYKERTGCDWSRCKSKSCNHVTWPRLTVRDVSTPLDMTKNAYAGPHENHKVDK